jgi:hypothetical protein
VQIHLENIHVELLSVHLSNTLALSTVYKLHQHVVKGPLCDDPRSGTQWYASGMAFHVLREALCPLWDWKCCVLTHSARCSASWKVYFMWQSAFSGSQSKAVGVTLSHTRLKSWRKIKKTIFGMFWRGTNLGLVSSNQMTQRELSCDQ